jgi:hypothetical protein
MGKFLNYLGGHSYLNVMTRVLIRMRQRLDYRRVVGDK